MFMERMRYYRKEHFISLMINAKGHIIEETLVSVGDLCSSTTHPREVFVEAVRRSAGSVVFYIIILQGIRNRAIWIYRPQKGS